MLHFRDNLGFRKGIESVTRWSELDCVSLQNAVLCANCEMISASSTSRCAVCGSAALLCISRLLGEPLHDLRSEWTIEGGGNLVASAGHPPDSESTRLI